MKKQTKAKQAPEKVYMVQEGPFSVIYTSLNSKKSGIEYTRSDKKWPFQKEKWEIRVRDFLDEPIYEIQGRDIIIESQRSYVSDEAAIQAAKRWLKNNGCDNWEVI